MNKLNVQQIKFDGLIYQLHFIERGKQISKKTNHHQPQFDINASLLTACSDTRNTICACVCVCVEPIANSNEEVIKGQCNKTGSRIGESRYPFH